MTQAVPQQSLHDLWVAAGPVCGAPYGEYSKPRTYLDYYNREFADLRDLPLKIVEVGVFRGQFLEALARYFPNASIVGIDFQIDRARFQANNITLVPGHQGDALGLAEICRWHAPEGIDILIDDASHVAELSKSLYDVAIHKLKPGGSYYIEDWETGYYYRDTWPDGAPYEPAFFEGEGADGFPARLRSHDAGMVGFVKSLVDHVGVPEIVGSPAIASMTLWSGVTKLIKASEPPITPARAQAKLSG